MTEKVIQVLRATPKSALMLFHHGWGTGIRNAFGLWRGNEALLRSCAEDSSRAYVGPDDASEVIFEAVWRRLQEPQ